MCQGQEGAGLEGQAPGSDSVGSWEPWQVVEQKRALVEERVRDGLGGRDEDRESRLKAAARTLALTLVCHVTSGIHAPARPQCPLLYKEDNNCVDDHVGGCAYKERKVSAVVVTTMATLPLRNHSPGSHWPTTWRGSGEKGRQRKPTQPRATGAPRSLRTEVPSSPVRVYLWRRIKRQTPKCRES